MRNSISSSKTSISHMAFAFLVGLIAVVIVCTTSGTLAAPAGDQQHQQHPLLPASSYVDVADYTSEFAAYPASGEADPKSDLSAVFFSHPSDVNANDEADDSDTDTVDGDAAHRLAASSSEGSATMAAGTRNILNDEAVEDYATALALANRNRKRSMQSFIRLGRQPRPSGSGFVRFGRGSNPAPARLDGFMRFGRAGHGFMRFGRNGNSAGGSANQMPSDALRFGRRGDNFIRFGKRAGSAGGGGRDAQMLLMDGVGSGEKDRLDRIERNGKQFIRFGRRDDAFMRLGKKSFTNPEGAATLAAADSGSGST